jgi:hypothetical protein
LPFRLLRRLAGLAVGHRHDLVPRLVLLLPTIVLFGCLGLVTTYADEHARHTADFVVLAAFGVILGGFGYLLWRTAANLRHDRRRLDAFPRSRRLGTADVESLIDAMHSDAGLLEFVVAVRRGALLCGADGVAVLHAFADNRERDRPRPATYASAFRDLAGGVRRELHRRRTADRIPAATRDEIARLVDERAGGAAAPRSTA